MSLLSINDLYVEFNTESVVSSVSFEIAPQEIVALVGESGSGKSVTAQSILQLLPNAQYPQGQIHFEDQDLLTLSEKDMQAIRGRKIGMIFQEPMTALNPLHRIGKQIGERLTLHQNMNDTVVRTHVCELLESVGIRDPHRRIDSYPHQLSGGQRQRVMIAMAIANEPKLLIADEPTTALDVTIQAQILELLQSLQQQLGLSILLITHDLGVVKSFADRTLVMHQGRIIEVNATEQLFAHPKQTYTQTLIAAEPDAHAPVVSSESAVTLQTQDLQVVFDTKKSWFSREQRADFIAVDQASIELYSGQTLGLVGESGSGKSSLAQAILRLIPATGHVHYYQPSGESVDLLTLTHKQLRPFRSDLQMVFQDPFASLSPRLTVAEIIAEGLKIHHPQLTAEAIEQQICDVLTTVDLAVDYRFRYPHEFSGGQRQRIAIARALILKPKMMILDEPTSALDRSVQNQVLSLLKNLQTQYQLSYLFISHDLKVIRSMSHRVIVMQHGKIVEQGNTEQIFTDPQTDYTRQLLAAVDV